MQIWPHRAPRWFISVLVFESCFDAWRMQLQHRAPSYVFPPHKPSHTPRITISMYIVVYLQFHRWKKKHLYLLKAANGFEMYLRYMQSCKFCWSFLYFVVKLENSMVFQSVLVGVVANGYMKDEVLLESFKPDNPLTCPNTHMHPHSLIQACKHTNTCIQSGT